MPIFTRNNIHVLYIHVPKTGGTYIERFFKKNGFSISEMNNVKDPTNKLRNCSRQHMHAEQINQLYNLKKFNYVFMTVRNPVFRFRSEFIMRNTTFNEEPKVFWKRKKDINAWWKMARKNFSRNPYTNDNHIRPQSDFYIKGVDIFKQEDSYDEVWAQKLESKIGVKFDFLSIQRRKDVEQDYGDDLKKIILSDATFEEIKNFYQADYSLFNYSTDVRW
jgi:hypothetical protein